MRMPDSERHKWLDALKHRFLRHKHLQQKQRVLRTVDKMHKMVDEVLIENGKDLTRVNYETNAEHKKTTIRRLLTSTDTKYPLELKTNIETEQTHGSTDDETLQLAELLLQTAAKTKIGLSEKVHPTFAKVDSTETQQKWKNKTEVLKINYKDSTKVFFCLVIMLKYFV